MNEAKTEPELRERETEATQFLNDALEPLHERLQAASPAYSDMFKDVVSLIAFPDPQVCCAMLPCLGDTF